MIAPEEWQQRHRILKRIEVLVTDLRIEAELAEHGLMSQEGAVTFAKRFHGLKRQVAMQDWDKGSPAVKDEREE